MNLVVQRTTVMCRVSLLRPIFGTASQGQVVGTSSPCSFGIPGVRIRNHTRLGSRLRGVAALLDLPRSSGNAFQKGLGQRTGLHEDLALQEKNKKDERTGAEQSTL